MNPPQAGDEREPQPNPRPGPAGRGAPRDPRQVIERLRESERRLEEAAALAS